MKFKNYCSTSKLLTGWRIHDYRTARKAARAGLFTAAVAGAVAGTVAAAGAIRRRVT